MAESQIEFIEDISLYAPAPRKPKPSTEIIMGPMVPETYTFNEQPLEKTTPTFPSYYQPELFSGMLPSEYQAAFLPPPSGTTTIQNLKGNHTGKSEYDDIENMNCRDIAYHIKICPVCSKLHKSNSYIYAGIIIFLVIICVFLGRRFFDQ